MEAKLGEEKDMEVELELCLTLGGPFKKTENSSKRKRIRTECNGGIDSDFNNGEKKACGVHKPGSRVKYPYPYRVEQVKEKNVGNGYGYGSGKVKENGEVGSPVCSSSDVSDPSSSSPRQGGSSSDSGGNSTHTRPVQPPVNNNSKSGIEETKEEGTVKPAKASENSNEESMLSFAQMPCVMSTGNGPEGRTVKGFLYRYSKAEVSIICVCHGRSFTPAEFIEHAGGTQVSHPLRHITVVPSAF